MNGWRQPGRRTCRPGTHISSPTLRLDGFVDGPTSLNGTPQVLRHGLWSLGDANGDGVTDGQDFIEWNTNKFMSSDAEAAVPEPGMSVFLMAALIGLAVVRRR